MSAAGKMIQHPRRIRGLAEEIAELYPDAAGRVPTLDELEAVAPASWRADDAEPLPDGTVGGDGAHDSVSVRFSNPDYPRARITTYWYVYDKADRGEDVSDGYAYDVENMTEFYIGTDDDEEWCDYEYACPGMFAYKTLEDAEAYRDSMAAAEIPNASLYYQWNGEVRA